MAGLDHEELPTTFDVVVVGSGLPEAILAAAFARCGLNVLHMDKNDYYGSDWASFSLEAMEQWLYEQRVVSITKEKAAECSVDLGEDEQYVPFHEYSSAANVNSSWNLSDDDTLANVTDLSIESQMSDRLSVLTAASAGCDGGPDDCPSSSEQRGMSDDNDSRWTTVSSSSTYSYTTGTKDSLGTPSTHWTISDVRRLSRRFSLDLVPKLLFAKGAMVNLLVTSNVSRYAEFKLIDRILTHYDGVIREVPNCRASVFQSREISMVEKRLLMKFLSECLNFEVEAPHRDHTGKSLGEVLEEARLTPLLKHYILNSIAMTSPSVPAPEGLKRISRFLMSSGRYGNSPFLWPLYGCGELPQCFVRLCAVFGGTYCLRRKIDGFVISGSRCTAVVSEGQRIACNNLVVNSRFVSTPAKLDGLRVNRAILLTAASVCAAHEAARKNGQSSVLVMPHPHRSGELVEVLELPSSAMVCPTDMYVIYLSMTSNEPADVAFRPVIEQLFAYERSSPVPVGTPSASSMKLGDAEESNSEASSPFGPQLDELPTPTASSSSSREASTNPRSPVYGANGKPLIFWSAFYDQAEPVVAQDVLGLDNVAVGPAPDTELDYESPVEFARRTFARFYPDEEFLPQAPNPDEVLLMEAEEQNNGQEPGNGFPPAQDEPPEPGPERDTDNGGGDVRPDEPTSHDGETGHNLF